MSETGLMIIYGVLLVVGLILVITPLFKLASYFMPQKETSKDLFNKKECCSKIHRLVDGMEGQLLNLKQSYHNDITLIDKWERKIKEVEKEYTSNLEDYYADEMDENVSDIQKMIESGIKRIRQGKNPFDKFILQEDECNPLPKNEPNTVLDYIVCGGIFLVCGGFAYLGFASVGCAPIALTVVMAFSLFPHAMPSKSDTHIDFKHTLGFVLFLIIGGYLNIYVNSQSGTEQIIWICVLPIICGLIYLMVKHHKKVKEL